MTDTAELRLQAFCRARLDERGSTTLAREGCFPWSNPCIYISLAIRETASNPILKITKENLINY